jgi:hypothetical protein
MPQLKINKNEIGVSYSDFVTFEIGKLNKDELIVTDTKLYFKDLGSIGMDEIVLTSKTLQYNVLKFTFGDKTYRTTRWFFYGHAKTHDKIYTEGRSIYFLPIPLFSLKRALQWEEYMEWQNISQLTIFDIPDHSGKDFQAWQEAMRRTEEYEKLNYSKKVDL